MKFQGNFHIIEQCGTVAGEAMATKNGTVAHNGVAYKSKLAFFDLVTIGEFVSNLQYLRNKYSTLTCLQTWTNILDHCKVLDLI